MGDDLDKVAPGDPLKIRASTFNAFVDAARDFRERAASQFSSRRTRDTQSGILFVRNDTGTSQNLFAVLGLDAVVFKPDGKPATPVVLTGMVPDKAKHRGRFCILAEPAEAGKIARAWVDDVAAVRLLVPEEAEPCRFAEIDDGSTAHLRAGFYGSAAILWREGGTGEQWAVVRLGTAPALFPVKLDKVGGSQGTSTVAASWTYDVKDPCTNEVLAEAVDPTADPHQWKRPSVGQMIAATYGFARFDDQGEVVLGWINETVDQEECD